jgi:hypothetical protein
MSIEISLDTLDKIASIITSISLAIFTYLLYRIERRGSNPIIKIEWDRGKPDKRKDGNIGTVNSYVFLHNIGGAHTTLKGMKVFINDNFDVSNKSIIFGSKLSCETLTMTEQIKLPYRISANSTASFYIMSNTSSENIEKVNKIEIIFEYTHGKKSIIHVFKD